MNYHLLFPLLFAVLFAAVAQGVSHARDPEPVSAQLRTLSWNSNIKDLWYQSDAGPERMEAYERDFTMPVEYIGPQVIRFYASENDLSLPPEDRPDPVAVARLPANGGAVLLLFVPKDDAEKGWNVAVIDDSRAGFPNGSYRFFNMTNQPIRVALDRQRESIPATSSAIMRLPSGDANRDIPVLIATGEMTAYSSIWGHTDKRRTTVFVVPDPHGRHGIGLRRFYQASVKEDAAAD